MNNSSNNKTYHIELDPNQEIQDKYIMINLNQSYEFLDILSLKLSLSKLKSYRAFSSDYGIITGRVIANNGVGLPNCKINIFIPKTPDEEIERQTKNLTFFDKTCIKIGEMFYPFKTPRDLDSNGKQFNLLSKFRRFQRQSGFPNNDYGIGFKPVTPVGSFYEKEEILTNRNAEYVYNKYFKYSTVTNESGDYMMIVPTGSYELVMNCDITDIGPFSVSPKFIYDTKPVNYDDFEENGTKIKEGITPQNAPNIIMQTIPVNIKSLWSNSQEEATGINYQNINILQNITPTALITGSNFGMNKNSYYMDYAIARIYFGFKNMCIKGKIGYNPPSCDTLPFDCGGDVIGKTEISFVAPTSFGICITVILPPIFPYLKVSTSLFQKGSVFRCRNNGGKLDLPPLYFKYIRENPCICDPVSEGTILDAIDDPNDLTSSFDLGVQEINTTKIKILSLNDSIDNNVAELLNKGDVKSLDSVDITNDIKVLTRNQYAEINNAGVFSIEIPMNYRKKITNPNGQLVDSIDGSGVYTENRSYFLIESDTAVDSPPNKAKTDILKIKVPTLNQTSNNVGIDYDSENPKHWICRHHKFEFSNIYTTSMYMNKINMFNTFYEYKGVLMIFGRVLLGLSTEYTWDFDAIRLIDLKDKDLVSNKTLILNKNLSTNTFENNWLNGSLYFMNIGYVTKKKITKDVACEYLVSNNRVNINNKMENVVNIRDNKNPLGANLFNNKLYTNSLNFPTEFIKLNKSDYVDFYSKFDRNGIARDKFNLNESNLYKTNNDLYYFYKGLNSNFINLNLESNLV